MSGGKGLILDTVLPVHWSDVRSLVLPAVADRRRGPVGADGKTAVSTRSSGGYFD